MATTTTATTSKDYRDFTGTSPSAFFLQDTQAPERGFGLVEA